MENIDTKKYDEMMETAFKNDVRLMLKHCEFNLGMLDEILDGVKNRDVSFKRPNCGVLLSMSETYDVNDRFSNVIRAYTDVMVLCRELDRLEDVFVGKTTTNVNDDNFKLLKTMTINAISGVRASLEDLKCECEKYLAK
jgi:hypothetical protein